MAVDEGMTVAFEEARACSGQEPSPVGESNASWPKYPRPKVLPKPIGGVVAGLVRRIGGEAALDLVERCGGTRIYVPHHPAEADCYLAEIVCLQAANKIAEEYGGTQLNVPLAKDWRLLIYHYAGCSYTEIARYLCMTTSGVHRLLKVSGVTDPNTAHERGQRNAKITMRRRNAYKVAKSGDFPTDAGVEENQVAKVGDLKSAPDQMAKFGHLVVAAAEGPGHD